MHHRTGYGVAQVDKVIDGDIEGFIDAYLKWRHGRIVRIYYFEVLRYSISMKGRLSAILVVEY